MLVMMSIVVWMKPDPRNILFAATLALIIVVSVLCFSSGNMGAAYPYAVTVEQGKGLQLYAPFKKLYIPIQDIQDVRKSLTQQGYVVRLKRPHRLLTSFVIHSFFGDQGEPLARAIESEIRRHTALTNS